jgi:FAD/FMN-containing dehydrogenase
MTTSAATTTAPYAELAAVVRGDLIMPGDPGYDQARAVYNGMIDKYPAAIARCRDTADVIGCVRFAREHGIAIAVRGGGHNAAGLGVWDDALVIDLSLLRSTTVDPDNRTVRADAGCTWGDVDHATVAFGMATPSGFLASTGVAGLTLGGGIGYLTRRFGLYPIDGAASRVPADATAFAYRDGGWAGVIVGVDPDPANAGRISQWTRDYWQDLHPTSAGGAYVNFLMDEGQDRVKAAYRGNYDRLTQVKHRYDPDNVFHINQNIQPASGPNP